MNEENIFEFRKERDLGETINGTFAFIGQNWRDIFSKSWRIILPYFLILIVSSFYYLLTLGNLMKDVNKLEVFSQLGNYLINVLVYILSLILFYAITQLTILNYIRLYIENEGEVYEDDLRRNVYDRFFSIIVLDFLIGIIIVAGMMFFFIPGIYFSIVLLLAPFIFVFEFAGISESISKSFSLIKDNWWMTFATFIVVSIVIGVISYVFSLPAGLYQMGKVLTYEDGMPTLDTSYYYDPAYLVLYLISIVGQALISVISLIAMSLIYFNLYEKKNFTNILDKIEDIGSDI